MRETYGDPAEVPAKLRALLDPERTAWAREELFQDLAHQGTVWEATPAAAPFVAEIALGAELPRVDRFWLVVLVSWLAQVGVHDSEYASPRGIQEMWVETTAARDWGAAAAVPRVARVGARSRDATRARRASRSVPGRGDRLAAARARGA